MHQNRQAHHSHRQQLLVPDLCGKHDSRSRLHLRGSSASQAGGLCTRSLHVSEAFILYLLLLGSRPIGSSGSTPSRYQCEV